MRGFVYDTVIGDRVFPPYKSDLCLFSGTGAELTELIDTVLYKISNKEICKDCGGDIVTDELAYDAINADESVGIGGYYYPKVCEVCGAEVEEGI